MKKPTNSSLWQPLTIPNLLLLFIGENISLIGDQFYLVALPWLTIQLTNSGVSVGTVLMAAAIPRAILMLIGGVVSDRLSPRLVMLLSNALRALLTILLTIIVSLQVTQLWHLYLFAITFGIVDGFFIPAAKSILPSLVSKEQLVASNTLIQGTSQLILLIGPALGGLLIATSGIEKAFAIDAATFIVAVITLSLMKVTFKPNTMMTKNPSSSKILSLMTGIREGINYAWQNPSLRAVLLVLMMLNFLIIGPLQVGITSLAHNRFSGGVVALGIMNSAWGGGGLLGTLIPQLLPNLPSLGVLMLSLASIQGFGLFLLGFIPNIVLASAIIAVLGCCGGFFSIVGITWIQKRTPPEIIGRVMSLGMLSSFGIAPFSFALSGLLAGFNLTILFTLAGSIMLMTTAFLSANKSVRTIN
ncbi:MFS transporter [Anabaena cylindrica UHCC 0172]|uniref:MFS transporter n=1 Tax=Anabaena cylindrica TaxID=1165 RepID=UPI002B21D714|nr:MFS transporter [Anabaena cylindrica]MEA5549543.1 MFS transporter [Anabaena cylindrica UHCC 0172]